jgi:hypothetical protein
VGGRTCHPCSMYVSGRCHKDATPRVAPACHAMPRHAKQCGYFLIIQSENYSTNNPLPPLILHLHQSLSTAFARSQSEARYASLAPPSPPPTVPILSTLLHLHPTLSRGAHQLRATGMSASSVLLVRRVAWRGIGGAVGRGGESSCAVSLPAWRLGVQWQCAESQGPHV